MVVLKAALHLWAALPLFFLLWAIGSGHDLGTNPQEEILRGLGEVSLVLLLWVYALPLWALWLDSAVLAARRAMGLWTCGYAVIHFLAYLQFEHDRLLVSVLKDIGERPFVSVGLLGLLLLLSLAATSNRFSVRRLGSRWKALHRLVHLIVVLSLLHFFLHKMGKNDYREVWVYASAFIAVALLKAWPGKPLASR